jgi:hypothetical protein
MLIRQVSFTRKSRLQSEEIVYDILLELSALGKRDVEIDQKLLDIMWVDRLLDESAQEIDEDDGQ